MSKELILKMKTAGLTHIELGVESGSARMQKLINKNLSLQKVEEIVLFLLENKIRVELFFMYGFPEETEEDLNQTLELIFSLLDKGVAHITMAYCRFNPMTAITEKYRTDLVLDPKVKVLARGVFGYSEEISLIEENRDIFPFFYHLHTPVRNQYQYMIYFVYLYRQYPHAARWLRKLYAGDNIRFYNEFCRANAEYLQGSIDEINNAFVHRPIFLLENLLRKCDVSYIKQLFGLLLYEETLRKVKESETDITVRETYDFNYAEFKLGIPIEQYSCGKTELQIEKIKGKVSLKVLLME